MIARALCLIILSPLLAYASPATSKRTSPGTLEARRQISLGWSRIKLDPAAALKHFEAAITAAPKDAAVRVQRAKARLAAGDAPGALGDADDAVRMAPESGEAYSTRAEAKRALGLKEAELFEDLKKAAELDGRFTEPSMAAQFASASRGAGAAEATAAPVGPLGRLTRSPDFWPAFAFAFVMLAAACGVILPPLLRRRRSTEDGSPPR